MELDKMQELIVGYSLDILDEGELADAQKLVDSDPEAQAMLLEFQKVMGQLALSVTPMSPPSGSLERLRQKAGIAVVPALAPEPLPLRKPEPLPFPVQKARKPNPYRNWLAYAAALVLFMTSAIFGGLWLDTRNNLDQTARSKQDILAVLASSDMKVTSLKPANSNVGGTLRLYTDPAQDRAYVVSQNLTALPGDKEYEAWFVTNDNQVLKAGLLGQGGSRDPTVQALDTRGTVENFKAMVITIEKKGGVEKSEQQPVLVGEITS